jgi:hypothetical protein
LQSGKKQQQRAFLFQWRTMNIAAPRVFPALRFLACIYLLTLTACGGGGGGSSHGNGSNTGGGNPSSQTFALTVAFSGTGTGTVTSTPSAISCTASCSANVPAQATVQLVALPDDGSILVKWQGDCTTTFDPQIATVTMTSAKNCAAVFADPTKSGSAQSVAVVIGASGSGTATVSDTYPTTINVSAPGAPIDGLQLNIPASAFGGSTETISISYSSALPAPLRQAAQSAGMQAVSASLTLSTSATSPFLIPITVTLPFNSASLAATDVPVVFYYDPSALEYDAMQTVNIDQPAAKISFLTRHFSTYVALAIRNILQSLQTGPLASLNIDTGFRPDPDGFAVGNIDTQTGWAKGGACYGLTSFAKWYYQTSPSQVGPYNSPGLYNDPSLNAGFLGADDVARELIYWTFDQTIWANTLAVRTALLQPWIKLLAGQADRVAGITLLQALILTNRPQLVILSESSTFTGGFHSVLVYRWNTANASFYFYNPNTDTIGAEQSLAWNPLTGFSWPYATPSGLQFNRMALDSYQLYFTSGLLQNAYSQATVSWPSPRRFDKVSLQTDSSGNASILWTPHCLECDKCCNFTGFAHFYVNNVQQTGPFQSLNVGTPTPVTLPASYVANGGRLSIDVSSQDYATPEAAALNHGYEGFWTNGSVHIATHQCTLGGYDSSVGSYIADITATGTATAYYDFGVLNGLWPFSCGGLPNQNTLTCDQWPTSMGHTCTRRPGDANRTSWTATTKGCNVGGAFPPPPLTVPLNISISLYANQGSVVVASDAITVVCSTP